MASTSSGKAARPLSAAQAAGLVRSGQWLDYGAGLGQPDAFDRALAERTAQLRDVKVRACLTVRPRAILDADPEGQHYTWFNWHFSGYDRKKHDAGICRYIPLHLGEVPDYYRRFIDPPDIAVIKTCPIDKNGNFNFSGANFWHRAVVERSKLVIVETCAGLPYVNGPDNGVHISEVDYIVAGDDQAAPATM